MSIKYYHKYWERIAEELQLFGGNTIVNIFRKGTGVLYREIVLDVAKHIKASINKNDIIENIEDAIATKLTLDLLEKMSEEQIKEFFEEITLMNENIMYFYAVYDEKIVAEYKDVPWRVSSPFIVDKIFKIGKFTSYKMTLRIVNLIWKNLFGREVSFIAKRSGIIVGEYLFLGMAGPILIELAGPAKRITVPAVLLISCLRKEVKLRKC